MRKTVSGLLVVLGVAVPAVAQAQTITMAGTAAGLTIQRTVTLTGAGTLHGLDIDRGDGTVFIIGDGGRDLYRVNTDNSFSQIANNVGSFVGILSDLKLGPDGFIYVSTTNVNPARIQRFAKDGTPQMDLASYSGGGSNAAGFDFDCAGNLYISDIGSDLHKVTPGGIVSVFSSGWNDIDAVQFAHNNVFFVHDGSATAAGRDKVFRIAPDGTQSTYVTIAGARLYTGAYDWGSRDYFTADFSAGDIYRLHDDNNNGVIEMGEFEMVATGFPNNAIGDIETGPSSNDPANTWSLYVSSGTNQQVVEITGLPPAANGGDCGNQIDDDDDGFCEMGEDLNNDGDCNDPGENTMAVDCDDNDNARFPGNTETCDNKDNDCNGQTDENFSDKGDACTDGVGACSATGVRVCAMGGAATECSATPGVYIVRHLLPRI